MPRHYQLDPAEGSFTVQAFADGWFASLAPSPTFAVRDFAGAIRFERDEVASLVLDLTARTDSLEPLDRLPEFARAELFERMRRDVIDPEHYPTIAYRSDHVTSEPFAPGRFRVRIEGLITLRGVTTPHPIGAEVAIYGDGIRLVGESSLRPSDFGIGPLSGFGGAIRVRDEMKIAFDLAGRPHGE